MDSTIFVLNKSLLQSEVGRIADEIAKLLQPEGYVRKGRGSKFTYPEGDHFIGLSFCFELRPRDTLILLEISKFFEDPNKIPPKLTKDEISNLAERFLKIVKRQIPIAPFVIRGLPKSTCDRIEYVLGENKLFGANLILKNGIRRLKIPTAVHIYYFEEDAQVVPGVYEKLRWTFRGFKITIKIDTQKFTGKIGAGGINCLLIKPNSDNAWLEGILKIIEGEDLLIFDYDKLGDGKKWANIVCQILAKNGSEIWQVHNLDTKTVFVGIDLGHDHARRLSRLCCTFFNGNGTEFRRGKILKIVGLNEKMSEVQLTKEIQAKLDIINKHYEFQNLVIHKDGRVLENPEKVYELLKGQNKSVSIMEVIKSNSAFVFDLGEGECLDFGTFRLLQTIRPDYQGTVARPLKTKLLKSDQDANLLMNQIYQLSKVYAQDSIYGQRRLPVTTYIADIFSSFFLSKKLAAFNRK
ncbi:MAG: hypothetical protein Q7S09_04180 [bacterium]|nr:hypothetical protein [bacterium]